jgi:hypothetical protein
MFVWIDPSTRLSSNRMLTPVTRSEALEIVKTLRHGHYKVDINVPHDKCPFFGQTIDHVRPWRAGRCWCGLSQLYVDLLNYPKSPMLSLDYAYRVVGQVCHSKNCERDLRVAVPLKRCTCGLTRLRHTLSRKLDAKALNQLLNTPIV